MIATALTPALTAQATAISTPIVAAIANLALAMQIPKPLGFSRGGIVPSDIRGPCRARDRLTRKKAKNALASHPVNAMLNYAYALLQAKLQIEAVAEGYDPTLGIMHHGYKGSPAYLFDLMEPLRPVVDKLVLSFALASTFSRAEFVIREDGVCRLAPQLSKRVCSLFSRDDALA